jgi:hypothetical protein
MMIAEPFSQHRAQKSSGPTRRYYCCDNGGERPSGSYHGTYSHHRSNIDQSCYYSTLRVADGLGRDVSRPRHRGVISHDFDSESIAELFFNGCFTCQQSKVSPMETGTEQFVDGVLKLLVAMKNSHSFPNGTAFVFGQHRMLR